MALQRIKDVPLHACGICLKYYYNTSHHVAVCVTTLEGEEVHLGNIASLYKDIEDPPGQSEAEQYNSTAITAIADFLIRYGKDVPEQVDDPTVSFAPGYEATYREWAWYTKPYVIDGNVCIAAYHYMGVLRDVEFLQSWDHTPISAKLAYISTVPGDNPIDEAVFIDACGRMVGDLADDLADGSVNAQQIVNDSTGPRAGDMLARMLESTKRISRKVNPMI